MSRLLFDQNISFRIVKKLAGLFPGSAQVRELGLEGKSDSAIWLYAKQNEFAIVTFDADFMDIATLKGTPPKVIWLRFGNTSTVEIAARLQERASLIAEFLASPAEEGILEVF